MVGCGVVYIVGFGIGLRFYIAWHAVRNVYMDMGGPADGLARGLTGMRHS